MLNVRNLFAEKDLDYKPPKHISVSRDAIHIVLCYDVGEYNVGMKALLNSVISNTETPSRLSFHFITLEEHLPQLNEFVEELREMHKGLKFDYSVWSLWEEVQHYYPDKNRFKNSLNLARIYMPRLFPHLEKVISLDTDMVLNVDVAELWDTANLVSKPIAAAASASPIGRYVHQDHPLFSDTHFFFGDVAKQFDFEEPTFSCGIFVANLTEWKRLDFIGRIHKVLVEHSKSPVLTDTTLKKTLVNIVFHQNWFPVDPVWNGGSCQLSLRDAVREKMLHFSGSLMSKPWDPLSQCTKDVRRLWFKYFLLFNYQK